MATYGVDIEIGVKGQQKLQDLSRQVKQLGRATDLVAESLGKKGKVSQSVENYNQVLQRTEKTLRTVIAGTRAETKAIQQYAQALNNVIAIEQRQQKLVRAAFRATPAGQAELELTKARKSLEVQRAAAKFREDSAKSQAAFEQAFLESAKRSNERVNERIKLQERLNSGLRKGAFEARMLAENTRLAAERKVFGTQFLGPATPLKAEQASAIAAAQSTERLVRERSAQAAAKLVFNKNLELALLTKIVGKTGEQGLLQKGINDIQQRMIRDGQALAAQKERALAADKKSADLAALQRKRGIGGAISSGLIGGGFPLLFGQSGAAAVGGAAGGFAGGALGGGFGFALSVVGTALGQAVEQSEQFSKSIIDLNSGIDGTAVSASITASEVNELANALGRTKEEAVEALAGFKDLGADTEQVKSLALVFGSDVGTPKALAAVEEISDLGKIILANTKKLGRDRAVQLLQQLESGDQLAVELELIRAIADQEERRLIDQQARISLGDRFFAGLAQAGAGAEGMAIAPIITPEQLRDERVARFSKKIRKQLGLAVPDVSEAVKGYRELLNLVNDPDSIKTDPTINLEKRLGIINAQIDAESKVVGLSSEGAAIVRRKLAFERKIAQIQETGKAERKRLTDLEDISLSNTIQTRAEKLATLQFEREIAVAVERSATASEKTLEPVQKKLDALKDRNAFEREYGELIMSGSTTAAAKQVIEAKKQAKEIDELVEKQVRSNDLQISILRVIVAQTIGTDAHAAAQEALNDALERENEIREKGKKAKGEIKGKKTPAENIEEEMRRVKAQLNDLLDPANQVIAAAQAIGDAFAESFKGLITGSMSAQEALANLFQRTADHFADMAAQMIAKQIQMKILGIALSFFDPGGGGGASSVPSSAYGDMSVAGPSFFAEGGYVSGPTRALVGEGGQSEYVIPENKMRESMARYSRGARGSSVIPETGASGTSGEGGGVAVAAPIDVRYSIERINNIDYVTNDQFQQGLQQAAAQGAQRGEQNTLKRLQMSGSTRRRLGM